MSIRPATMFTISAVDGSGSIPLPNPDRDSAKHITATFVNTGRSAAGTVNAQKIGRDQDKLELKWNYLEKEEWEKLVNFWDTNFYFNLTYYSRVQRRKITRVFYVGDRSDTPFNVDVNGIPTAYKDCSVKLVDTGVTP